jgi:hypothetical protein
MRARQFNILELEYCSFESDVKYPSTPIGEEY